MSYSAKLNKTAYKVALICIIGLVCSSFAAAIGSFTIIPDGTVKVFDGSQQIAELTAESPLPEGKTLQIEGKCGIKMDSLFLVASDKSTLSVHAKNMKQNLLVKNGKVFFGITEMKKPITFVTPNGSVLAQQVLFNAASQPSILEGFVGVTENEAEIGVIRGGGVDHHHC